MNTVQLIGTSVSDAKVTKTKNGLSRCSFKLVVDKRGKKGGADVFTVIAWRASAEIIGRYLKKGDKVGVAGYLERQEWEGDDGYRYEDVVVVMTTFTFCGKSDAQAEMTAATGTTASGAGVDTPDDEEGDDA